MADSSPADCPAEATTTAEPTQHCSFLDLPAELRNTIYHIAIASIPQAPPAGTKVPPLLQVNKQIRLEVGPIYYSRTNIRFNRRNVVRAMRWYSRLPEASRKALRSFQYETVLTGSLNGRSRMLDVVDEATNWAECYGVGLERSKIRFRVIPTVRDGEKVDRGWVQDPWEQEE